MRRIFILLVLTLSIAATAKDNLKYIEASELTLVGKLMPTSNPYHRVDTTVYKGFSRNENTLVRMSSGMAVTFKTNSKNIFIKAQYAYIRYTDNTNSISARGFDLYIKKDGQWLWAGANCAKAGKENIEEVSIIEDMDGKMKECLLYLPTYSEEKSIQIGVDEKAVIEAIDNPFRHRIAVFGSSFTHGSSTTRAGLAWPAQLSRMTGLQMLSLGCSGSSKLQDYFADVLADVEADAFLFDSFSNPSAKQIEERLFPFIERLQEAHPGVPLIFQRTIYREQRNFSLKAEQNQSERMEVADSLMAIAVKKYPNVYYITPNATAKSHETSVDGVHPDNYGYTLWAESISKPLVRILKKYGIK